MAKKTKKKWIRFRHSVVRNLLYIVLFPYAYFRYGLRVEPFRRQGQRQYLILVNHQTPFDQFFVGMAFKGPVYYMATEDIFSMGWVSKLIRYLIAPIPIKKQTTDIQAVINCLRVAKEGGTICIAPEGNRTYSGKTEHMNPAIVGLAKKLKLPVVLFRLEGGYGVQPRWSDVIRKGKIRAYAADVIEPEELLTLSDQQLFDRIEKGLAVNDPATAGRYVHKRSAEFLERAMYVCPFCGLSEFESDGQHIRCLRCNRQIHYTPSLQLKGVNFDFPFENTTQWYDYQTDFVHQLDLMAHTQVPLYHDTAKLSEVIVYQRKHPLREEVSLCLYGDRIVVDEGREEELVLPFSEVSAMAVLGRNKLNIYHNGKVYQIKSSKRFNAVKYVNFYYRCKNIIKGDQNGKFLGL